MTVGLPAWPIPFSITERARVNWHMARRNVTIYHTYVWSCHFASESFPTTFNIQQAPTVNPCPLSLTYAHNRETRGRGGR